MSEVPKKVVPKNPSRKNPKQDPGQGSGVWIVWAIIIVVFLIFANSPNVNKGTSGSLKMSYSEFYALVKENQDAGQIRKLVLTEGAENTLEGTLRDGGKFRVNIPRDDKDLLGVIRQNVKDFTVQPLETFWSQAFFSFVPVFLIIFFIWFLGRRGAEMGNKIWSFGSRVPKSLIKVKTALLLKMLPALMRPKKSFRKSSSS